ncbi:MAG: DUF4399 domain-containing protein [Steroidobacteraceae bacterium]
MKKPMFLALITAAASLAQLTVASAQMPPQATAPAGTEVYIIAPADGAKVTNPVVVRFGLKGMGIAPAGIQMEATGHHHLFVDTDLPTDMTKPIGTVDNKIIHFGKGQTETTLTLAPGKHTLQLLLGDYLHVPNSTPVSSKKITITVTK